MQQETLDLGPVPTVGVLTMGGVRQWAGFTVGGTE